MNFLEKTLIVSAVVIVMLVNIVAIIKNKKTKTKKPVEQHIEQNKEEKPPIKETPKEETKQTVVAGYSPDDFKDYLKNKSKTLKKPAMKNPNYETIRDLEYGMRSMNRNNKTLAGELSNLSPEMQAVIFAGLLDTKF